MMAYVDSSVWINRVEGLSSYQMTVENKLRTLKQEGWTICASEAVLLEALIKPHRNNKTKLLSLYYQIFSNMDILPPYFGMFKDALNIAVQENLHGMDAVHVALAHHYGCDKFVAADTHFKSLQIIPTDWIDLTSSSN